MSVRIGERLLVMMTDGRQPFLAFVTDAQLQQFPGEKEEMFSAAVMLPRIARAGLVRLAPSERKDFSGALKKQNDWCSIEALGLL